MVNTEKPLPRLAKRIETFIADKTRFLDLSHLGLTGTTTLEDLAPPAKIQILDISHNL